MELTNILHLTDLHLAETLNFNHERLLDSLHADLASRPNNGGPFDFCVFTGDLAFTGDEIHFELVLDQLCKILDAASLNEKQLVICPGNHDADRRVVGEQLPALKRFRKAAMTRVDCNALSTSVEFIQYATSAFRCFNALSDEFSGDTILYRDAFCKAHFLRSASVVTINTALLSAAGLADDMDDRGALAFPEANLVHALKQCPAGVPIVVIGHHPLEFLNDAHSALINRLLAGHCAAYFCGHLHDPLPKGLTTPNGNLFISQSGALYEPSEYWNGYAVIHADLPVKHFKETFRRWWEPRREFSHAEDLANNGVFYSSREAQEHWAHLPKLVDRLAFDSWRISTLLPTILKEYNESLTTSLLEDVFVRPEFERDIPFRKETEERVGSRVEILTFVQIFDDSANYVISAEKETGKSTVLKQMALALARRSMNVAQISVPVLLNFGSFRHYRTYIENMVRQRLPALPVGITAECLLEQGMVTLLVDEVDFRSIDRRDAMLNFFATYPKCRYILTSSTAFVESAALRPEISPDIPFVRVRMRRMRPSQLLALIENHGTRDPLKADQLLERVTRDAHALNVPLTAVTSTFLIQIFSEEPDNVPINQAALVERYIEMLLEKFAPRELLPATFNFKNKVDLLSVLAERMSRERRYEVDQNDFLTWIIEYLRNYGLKYRANDILRYLLDSKVIERDGDQIRFKLRVFFEFFLATRMREDEEFREYVFHEDNYLSYPHEISFYAAITLRDKARISVMLDRFKAVGARIPQTTASGVELSRYLESVQEPSEESTEEELFELQRQVRSPEQAIDDRKALMEGEGTELVGESSQEVVRPVYSTDEERWLGHLVLLSGMLKHMELIPDKEKREILSNVLDGWLRFTANSLGIVGTLAKERRVVFNGITYISLLAEDLTVGEMARRLALMMPIAVAKLASLFLATEKLQLQLEEGLGTTSEPPSRQFLRFAILSDLMVDNLSESAIKVEAAIRGHTYLVSVFARKLYEIAVRYRLPDDELRRIRSIVGDLGAPANAGSHRKHDERNERKVRVIRGLERQRLVATFKKADR